VQSVKGLVNRRWAFVRGASVWGRLSGHRSLVLVLKLSASMVSFIVCNLLAAGASIVSAARYSVFSVLLMLRSFIHLQVLISRF